jgi:serine phosphatase RsbU (regulator of sigma subunit)
LLRALETNRSRSAREVMDGVIADVQGFSVGEQADDLTLVVARVF